MDKEDSHRPTRRGDFAVLLREWLALEAAGHLGLILLRQLFGRRWTWESGGPFAYWDVSRAMIHGDALWVVAVVCTSAIHLRLLAEWGHLFGRRRSFGRRAWLPWLVPGCLLGWIVLIRGDSGAAYILSLPAGPFFEAYHILFFGYVFARLAAATTQLSIATRLILHRCHRAARYNEPRPALPLGVGLVACIALICALVYLHIFKQGGAVQAEWAWLSRG